MNTPESKDDDRDPARYAFHEAGHAVAAFALGLPVEYVTANRLPPQQDEPEDESRHYIIFSAEAYGDETDPILGANHALVMFAGDAAEMRYLGGRPSGEKFGNGVDYSFALGLAWGLFSENRQRHAFLDEAEGRAANFVREPLRWHQIRAIATVLLDRRELSGCQAFVIFDEAARSFGRS